MKYVIVESEMGCELPILFDDILDHSKVASGFHKVFSAGYCMVYQEKGDWKAATYGRSVTLKMEPRQDDARLITKMFQSDM